MSILKNPRAIDLMTSPISTFHVDMSLELAAQALSEGGISGALVCGENGRAVGVISLCDITAYYGGLQRRPGQLGGFYRPGGVVTAEGGEGTREIPPAPKPQIIGGVTVGMIMTPEIITVPPTASAAEVARVMCEREVHRVFVAGSAGPVGIVSTLDVLRTFALRAAARSA